MDLPLLSEDDDDDDDEWAIQTDEKLRAAIYEPENPVVVTLYAVWVLTLGPDLDMIRILCVSN